jgi:phenylalanyl-tRNA synthetase beta chain
MEILDISHSATLWSAGEMVGVIGRVSPGGRKEFGLRQETVVAELNLSAWLDKHQVVRRQTPISEFPAVQRDFNFILAEQVPWSELDGAIRRSGGEFLEQITYRETFRDPAKDGPDRKRVLLSLQFRSSTKTLEGEEIELSCQRILQATQAELGAVLVG